MFEAGANDLAAGQSFLGQLEGAREGPRGRAARQGRRVDHSRLPRARVRGAYRERPTGVLDMLLPYMRAARCASSARRRPTRGTAWPCGSRACASALTALRIEHERRRGARLRAALVRTRAQGWPVPDEPTLREIRCSAGSTCRPPRSRARSCARAGHRAASSPPARPPAPANGSRDAARRGAGTGRRRHTWPEATAPP